jgi:hypothetical protein
MLHRLQPHTTQWPREWFDIHFLMTEWNQGLYYCSVQALRLLPTVLPQLSPKPQIETYILVCVYNNQLDALSILSLLN